MKVFESPSFGGLMFATFAGASFADLLAGLTTKFPSALFPVWLLTYILNALISWVPFVACYLATNEWRGLGKVFMLPWSFYYVVDFIFLLIDFKTLLKHVEKEKMRHLTFQWVFANFWHALLFATFQSDKWDQSIIQATIAITAAYYRLNLSRMLSSEAGLKSAGRLTLFHALLLSQIAVRHAYNPFAIIDNLSNHAKLTMLAAMCVPPVGFAFVAAFPGMALKLWKKIKSNEKLEFARKTQSNNDNDQVSAADRGTKEDT